MNLEEWLIDPVTSGEDSAWRLVHVPCLWTSNVQERSRSIGLIIKWMVRHECPKGNDEAKRMDHQAPYV